MKKNVCAGEVTDMKCMNITEQNSKQSWKVDTGLISCSSHPTPKNWWEGLEKGETRKQLSSFLIDIII